MELMKHRSVPAYWQQFTQTGLILNAVYAAAKADLAGDREQYFKATLWFIRMMKKYLTVAEAKTLQSDLELLDRELYKIEREAGGDESKRNRSLSIKAAFADTHRALGFTAFSRSGIVYPALDGELDFDELSLEIIRRVVQFPFGKKRGLEKIINRVTRKYGAPYERLPE